MTTNVVGKRQTVERLSRRSFLRRAGTAAALGTTAWIVGNNGRSASASQAVPTVEPWGMLIDLTRCTGCNSCALACKQVNGLPKPEVVPQTLNSEALCFVQTCETMQGNGEVAESFIKRQCMNCLHPACASACTVGALRKTPEGPVVYNASKCIGCRYCQYACPFGVPTYEWDNPLGLIQKCNFCANRLSEGERPACVDACPTGAVRFGKRSDLLAQAHAQINSNPGRYVDHVYGEHEVGGTSMLYISDVSFGELGFPTLDAQPIPRYAEAVMTRTPLVALTVASVATGLSWLARRRQEVLASRTDKEHSATEETQ